MILSYSEIFKWQVCQRQHYYSFVLGLRPLEESAAIGMGVKGHSLLQQFYTLMREGKTKEEALELVTHDAKVLMSNEGVADYSLLKAWTLVGNYARATEFSSESILIENRFLLPVSKLTDDPELADVQIGFTPDLVVKRKGDRIDIEDAKFISRAWTKSKLNRFPQIKLYQIFMEQMGYEISRCIIRFFNVTTGAVSEFPYVQADAEKKILIRDFLVGVKEVKKQKEKSATELALAARTMNYTACQFCAYEYPCTLEAQGKDASKTLQTQYKKSEYDYAR
jgi:hypothetical protein